MEAHPVASWKRIPQQPPTSTIVALFMAPVIQVVSALYTFGTPSPPPLMVLAGQGGAQSFPAFAFPMTCVPFASIYFNKYM